MPLLYIAIVLFMAVNRPDLIYGRRVGELGSLWMLKLGLCSSAYYFSCTLSDMA